MSTDADLIAYRVQRAEEALREAGILAENKLWNGAINRIYYVCFYMVDALLIKKKISHKTHGGTKKQFNRLYAQSNELADELMKFYNTIFQDRQESDYGELVRYTQEDVDDLMPQAKSFHSVLKRIILED